MAKTQKELAFLRDLYLDEVWTQRFTDLVDKHVKFGKEKNFLYINAGSGAHALALSERISDKTAIFATCENDDILAIARDKAAAVKAGIDFSMLRFDDEAFDIVLADASLVRPAELREFTEDAVRVLRPGGRIGIFTVTAGSFGEIFSMLWEVLFNQDLGEHGAVAEKMIAEQPTVSELEEIAEKAGLSDVKSHSASEVFEFENGQEFIASQLVSEFLLPAWLETLDEKENEQVADGLARLIDDEDGSLSFRFTVKATLVTGARA